MRRYQKRIFFLMVVIAMVNLLCREAYTPPAVTTNNNFLVVEGMISTNDSTKITLSRTRNLADTITSLPEKNARVFVESESGDIYQLTNDGQGNYASASLNLNITKNYRLRIVTAQNEYASDFVPVKQAPPIDSLTWEQDRDVHVFVNTHDPANNTRYYRWEFSETWEYHTFYDSNLGYNRATGQVYFRDSADLLTFCWRSNVSNDILLATSSKLNDDIITHFQVATVPNGSFKISVRYSILVKQYALTQEAFEYWQLLKKNTEEVGTIFGSQPSQLKGNILCLTNPQEPVMGYVSAGTAQEKRIFIRRSELGSWEGFGEQGICEPIFLPADSAVYYLRDTSFGPAYFTTGALAIAKNICLDCRFKGGTTEKPSFW